MLTDKHDGKRFNAPNDIVVRKDGNVYFTDPAFGNQADTRELDFYGVYRITPKGQLSLIAKPKGRPNGITFSPNGRLLYVGIAIVVMVVVAATRGRLGYTAPTAGGATPTAVDRTVHITAPGGLL